MDPLSITAGVIAVLQATCAIINICRAYSAVEEAFSTEWSQVADQVESLQFVLEALAKLARTAKAPGVGAQVSARLPHLQKLCDHKAGPLVSCRALLTKLEKTLTPPKWASADGSRRQSLFQSLSWPSKEKDVSKLLHSLGFLQGTLVSALNVDQTQLATSMEDASNMMKERIDDIHSSIVSQQASESYRAMCQWLAGTLPHDVHRIKRQPGTGSWLVQSKAYLDWVSQPASFFWLYGGSGCGKTTLTSTVIDEISSKQAKHVNVRVLLFYFDINETTIRTHDAAIRSFLSQIIEQASKTPPALSALFSRCSNGGRQPDQTSLIEALRQSIMEMGDVYLIIDAVDECSERRSAVKMLEQILSWNLANLHTFVSSRDEPDFFKLFAQRVSSLQRVQVNGAVNEGDLRTYIRKRLTTDDEYRRWRSHETVRQEVEDSLMVQADGRFRWAVCQLDSLSACLNLPQLRQELSMLPRTLEATYTDILLRIDARYRDWAIIALQWLLHATQPLSLGQLVDVIATDVREAPYFSQDRRLPDQIDFLRICPSLITLSTEACNESGVVPVKHDDSQYSKAVVKLAHASVRDFLLSKDIKGGKVSCYSINPEEAHNVIASDCLAYLLDFNHGEPFDIKELTDHPLALYAAKHWATHAREVSTLTDTTTMRLALQLLSRSRNSYLNWIRLFDADEPWRPPQPQRNESSIGDPFYYVSLLGLRDVGQELLRKGVSAHTKGGAYGNALQAATACGHEAMVRLLLEAKADIDTEGPSSETALHWAVWNDHDAIVMLLLEFGASI